MLKCEQVSRLIAADEWRTARLPTRVAVRAHLLMCEHCRRFAAEIAEVGRALKQFSGDRTSIGIDADTDSDAVERILKRLPPRTQG